MSVSIQRTGIADHIVARLEQEIETVQAHFAAPDRIPSCQVKDLLPPELAREIFVRFPTSDQMMLKRSIKEHKHVAAQMDAYDPLLEEAVYAFQDPRVVALIAKITGFKGLEPDVDLYAGGISAMSKGAYLRPHLDNSHDKNRERYRVVNLLYYVTPDWRENYGGCLQLWDDGPKGAPRTFPCFFNSLVIMATGKIHGTPSTKCRMAALAAVSQTTTSPANCRRTATISTRHLSAASPNKSSSIL